MTRGFKIYIWFDRIFLMTPKRKVKQLYVDLMLLVISLLTLLMSLGFNITLMLGGGLSKNLVKPWA